MEAHSACIQQWHFFTTFIWTATWLNQQNDCAPSEDSDQLGHLPSLIRVFSVRMKKHWILSYPLSAQRRLIRLGGCPGWSESSLGAHAIFLVLSWGGSNDKNKTFYIRNKKCHIDLKFSDRQGWANFVDWKNNLIRDYTVCHSVFWTHNSTW